MDAAVLKSFAQIAGIGGISLGVVLVLFRNFLKQKIFPRLKDEQAYRLLALFLVLTWSLGLAGLGAWVWTETRPAGAAKVTVTDGIAAGGDLKIDGPVIIGGAQTKKP